MTPALTQWYVILVCCAILRINSFGSVGIAADSGAAPGVWRNMPSTKRPGY